MDINNPELTRALGVSFNAEDISMLYDSAAFQAIVAQAANSPKGMSMVVAEAVHLMTGSNDLTCLQNRAS